LANVAGTGLGHIACCIQTAWVSVVGACLPGFLKSDFERLLLCKV